MIETLTKIPLSWRGGPQQEDDARMLTNVIMKRLDGSNGRFAYTFHAEVGTTSRRCFLELMVWQRSAFDKLLQKNEKLDGGLCPTHA